MLWASWAWHSDSRGYPHWLPPGHCYCSISKLLLLIGIWKQKHKFMPESLEFFLVLQVKMRLCFFMNWARHHLRQTDCWRLQASQTCFLLPLNPNDSESCCSLWLVCESELCRCVKVPAGCGMDSPGHRARGEAEGETMRQIWRETLSTDAPFIEVNPAHPTFHSLIKACPHRLITAPAWKHGSASSLD